MLTKVLKSFMFSGSVKTFRFNHNSGSVLNMKIGTHDGVFHCDEVLACYMLKVLPEYKDAEIIRTRDPVKLSECDIVLDVGGIFDHEKKRYDHHQRDFEKTLSSLKPELGDKFNIKLSSAGLVFAYYGEQVIRELAPKDHQLQDGDFKLVYKKLYEHLICEIDAIDNGIPMTDEEPKYKIRTCLSSRVARLNPKWNNKIKLDTYEMFKKALSLVSEEFLHFVNSFISVWLPARDYVKTAIGQRQKAHESGQILIFNECLPWKEHLFDLEEEFGISGQLKYVLFSDEYKSWRVQAVPLSPGSFNTRKPLNKQWWGLRDQTLSDISGIEGCIFCHATGFIGGNTTKDGALKMAVLSLTAES